MNYQHYRFIADARVGATYWKQVAGIISKREIIEFVYPEKNLSDEEKISRFIEEYRAEVSIV